eukprot:2558650-Rhodomonas_salina.6
MSSEPIKSLSQTCPTTAHVSAAATESRCRQRERRQKCRHCEMSALCPERSTFRQKRQQHHQKWHTIARAKDSLDGVDLDAERVVDVVDHELELLVPLRVQVLLDHLLPGPSGHVTHAPTSRHVASRRVASRYAMSHVT